MKTPDEIKKGFEQYMSVDAYDCEISCKDSGCPYSGDERIGAETCGDLICADILAYIKQLEAKVPKWISVEERLPEDGKWVIVAEYLGERCIVTKARIKRYAGIKAEVWSDQTESLWGDVKYWMPMPEPPERKENEVRICRK